MMKRMMAFLMAVLALAATGAVAGENFGDSVDARQTYDDVKVVRDTVYEVAFRKKGMNREISLPANQVEALRYVNAPEAMQSGVNYALQGKFVKAIGLLEQAANSVKDKKHAQWVLFYLGWSYCQRRKDGDFDKALRVLDKLVKSNPQSRFAPQAYLYIGLAYQGKGQYAKAVSAFESGARTIKALSSAGLAVRRPELKNWILEKGFKCRLQIGKTYEEQAKTASQAKKKTLLKKALTAYSQLSREVRRFPASLRDEVVLARAGVLFQVGQMESHAGKQREAISALERIIIRSQRGSPVVSRTVGEAYKNLGMAYLKWAKSEEADMKKARGKDNSAYERHRKKAREYYMRSLFNWKSVTVQFFADDENGVNHFLHDMYGAWAHLNAGGCYERLKALGSKEDDLIKKAKWHYLMAETQYYWARKQVVDTRTKETYADQARKRREALR